MSAGRNADCVERPEDSRQPRSLPTLDELAAQPERAAELPVETVEKLLVMHAAVGSVLLGRLLATRGHAKVEQDRGARLLDAREAAERLGVPKSWISDMARQAKLPSVLLGHYVRFRAEDLDRFVIEHRRVDLVRRT